MTKKTEKKENQEQPLARKEAKGPTLKERISETVDKYEGEELKNAVFALVQRVLYPDQFCPECDDKLFTTGNSQECLNCGFTRELSVAQSIPNRTPQQPQAEPAKRGKVPEAVERAIQQADENMRDAPRNTAPSKRGEQIRKLAEKLGDSTVPATQQDTNILKNVDENVRDVNWL